MRYETVAFPPVIIVLLGAGASKDVGLPTSSEMVDNLLLHFRSDVNAVLPPSQQLFEFVVHGLRQQAAGRGDPAPVDVETVFDAIESLAGREHLSTAPFISAWHPLVDQAERTASAATESGRPESRLARQLREVIEEEHVRDTHRRRTDPSEQFIRELLGIGHQPGIAFGELAEVVLGALVPVLRLGPDHDVGYLEPLFELFRSQKALYIATLNYDITVETLGRLKGVPVDGGMSKWPEQQAVSFDPLAVNLYKLHGSVSWERIPKERIGARGMLSFDRIRELEFGQEPRLPSVIFGAGNKLVAGGPYLELLRAFERSLELCSVLLVVGYSFRDDHVNALITKWMNYNPTSWYTNPSRRLVILNPAASLWGRPERTPPMAYQLYAIKEDQPKRFKFISKSAKLGLEEAISVAHAEHW